MIKDQKEQSFGICLYKKSKDNIKILLGSSPLTKNKWGLLKGKLEPEEKRKDAAIREFYEESGIKILKIDLENYFYQKNKYKDIGIWTSNFYKISEYDKNKFYKDYLNFENKKENAEIKWFDIENLPLLYNNQSRIIKKIIEKLKI